MCDFNSDGNKDVIVANYTDDNIIVYQGNGKGSLSELDRFPVGENPTGIATSDINGDGIEDALISNWSGELLVIIGSKAKLESYKFKHASIPNPWGVALTDLNNDGKSDFIIADGDNKLAVVYVSENI